MSQWEPPRLIFRRTYATREESRYQNQSHLCPHVMKTRDSLPAFCSQAMESSVHDRNLVGLIGDPALKAGIPKGYSLQMGTGSRA